MLTRVQESAARLVPTLQPLDALLEREETPEAQASIDNVLSSPATKEEFNSKIAQLVKLKTPSTTPHPSRAAMHPETVHQSTTRAPDSALKLGFASPSKAGINTPSRLKGSQIFAPPPFQFSESSLSLEARNLMENVREEAARIKSQMQAEKEAQEQKDHETDQVFSGFNATGRKIAQPKAKAGRFSDVHKAQFHKMDSIANHASAYRGRPQYTQPTSQSLKRNIDKAGLDESERPRSAGKGSPNKSALAFSKGPSYPSLSDLNEAIPTYSHHASPPKRSRPSEAEDITHARNREQVASVNHVSSSIPRPISSTLLSPTKSSLARFAAATTQPTTIGKPSQLPRSSSVKSLKMAFEAARSRPSTSSGVMTTTSKPIQHQRPQSVHSSRPLPPIPDPIKTPKTGGLSSRLPTFAGLKSILRSTTRKISKQERSPTPKRPNTASKSDSARKVDFTPSVKSRHAVKLAAHSPSPAKHNMLSSVADPADYEESEDEWEDAEGEVDYPNLPPTPIGKGPVVHTFSEKAKSHGRRESKEFKSIFLTLGAPHEPVQPSTLTSVNTKVNRAGPLAHTGAGRQHQSNVTATARPSSTIRRVRTSDVAVINPFEDNIQTVDHGLGAKKRRRDSAVEDEKYSVDEDAKENRRVTMMPQVPGGWDDTDPEDDGESKRGAKRPRTSHAVEMSSRRSDVKKPSVAREAAAKNAKDRKKGILTMSKLNMLSKPKLRG